jgi:hypothetical protein
MGWKSFPPEPELTQSPCLICGEIVADPSGRCYIQLSVPGWDDPWPYEAHERCLRPVIHPNVEVWFKRSRLDNRRARPS